MARALSNSSSFRSRLFSSAPFSLNLLNGSQSRSFETLAYEEIPSPEKPFSSTAFVLHGLLGSGRNWRSFARGLESELKKFNSPDGGEAIREGANDTRALSALLKHHLQQSGIDQNLSVVMQYR